MVCPICGSKAELIFNLHCSNPKCQNFYGDVLVKSERSSNKRFWESFRRLDRVYFQQYQKNFELKTDEKMYLDTFPEFYLSRVGTDLNERMSGILIEHDHVLTFSHCDSSSHQNFYILEDKGIFIWSVIWLRDFDLTKDYF